MNIVLTGPMGTGKTTVGKALAKELNMDFIDTDSLIEKKIGKKIFEIFSESGEEVFRKYEEKIISNVSNKDNYVISTGGGVVLNPKNMKNLRKNGRIINLNASIKILIKRLKDKKDRPLLSQNNFNKDLKKYSIDRASFYKNADYIIDIDKLESKDIVKKICNILEKPVIRLCASIAGEGPEKQINQAIESGATIIELRLDLIKNPNIAFLIEKSILPVIATDRENENNLIEAIEKGCDFVDIDINQKKQDQIIKKARENNCKIIISYHDFEKTPEKIPIKKKKADLYKIATKINSLDDCRRLLNLLYKRDDLIVIGIGKKGIFTRIIAPILGSYLTYAAINEYTAPGQLKLKTMSETYKKLGMK